MLEQKHYAFDSDVAGDAAGQASSAKLKTIRELTLTLLQEVESLKGGGPFDEQATVNFAEEVRRFETELIRWALLRTGGHQRRAARLLGMKVTTLNAKIKRYGIHARAPHAANVVDLYPA